MSSDETNSTMASGKHACWGAGFGKREVRRARCGSATAMPFDRTNGKLGGSVGELRSGSPSCQSVEIWWIRWEAPDLAAPASFPAAIPPKTRIRPQSSSNGQRQDKHFAERKYKIVRQKWRVQIFAAINFVSISCTEEAGHAHTLYSSSFAQPCISTQFSPRFMPAVAVPQQF